MSEPTSVTERGYAMDYPKQPSKEAVRQWLHQQIEERRPPPDPKQIRRELGWELVRLERGEPTCR